jgi:hypothetical protein
MSIQYINTGTSANAGNGDSLRLAFTKVNNNFGYIEDIIASNTSTGGFGYTGSQGDIGYTGSGGNGGEGNGSIVQSENPPDSPTTSTLWYDTVGGRSYVYFDSSWVDASPVSNVVNLSTVTQDIIPGADSVYNLGSPTNQWKSLYVSTSTIYIGGVPMTVDTTTNTLLVNGSQVTGGSATTSTLVNGSYNFTLGVDGTVNFSPSGANGKGVLQTAADLQFIAVDKVGLQDRDHDPRHQSDRQDRLHRRQGCG